MASWVDIFIFRSTLESRKRSGIAVDPPPARRTSPRKTLAFTEQNTAWLRCIKGRFSLLRWVGQFFLLCWCHIYHFNITYITLHHIIMSIIWSYASFPFNIHFIINWVTINFYLHTLCCCSSSWLHHQLNNVVSATYSSPYNPGMVRVSLDPGILWQGGLCVVYAHPDGTEDI